MFTHHGSGLNISMMQENVIENNLHYFKDPMNNMDLKDLAEIQRQVAEQFISKYRLELYSSSAIRVAPDTQNLLVSNRISGYICRISGPFAGYPVTFARYSVSYAGYPVGK